MAQGISIFNRVRGQQFVSVPGPEASPVWILPLTYRPMLDALVFMTAAEVLWKVCTHRPLKSFAQCYQMISSSIQRHKDKQGRGHGPACKGSREQTKRDRGQFWKQQQAIWQTSTTTSRSGSRRAARHPNCFMSAMPTALPISSKGEEQSQAVKRTQLRKRQVTALTA